MKNTEIIDAAFRVWGRNFYRKTSLSQLAGELGVSKPALYRHFDNKQALTEAMTERFLDDLAEFVRADFERAQKAKDPDEGILTIISGISGYFARNVYALIFSFMNIYDSKIDSKSFLKRLKSRGVDMRILPMIIEKKYNCNPVIIQSIHATLIFIISLFHRTAESINRPLTEEQIQRIIIMLNRVIQNGIGCTAEKINSIDFEKLEKQINFPNSKPEPLFKAVAEAVAEAGPWNASMEMVARRLGFSKSSLYGHFKNKKDMLRRLFKNEYKRIIEFARAGMEKSGDAAQQLYLGIFSVAVYLRSKPEILTAHDWIRTRKLDLGNPKKELGFYRLFEDIDIETIRDSTEDEKIRISRWIFFLIIGILMRNLTRKKTEKNDMRILFRFITLGLGGFIK